MSQQAEFTQALLDPQRASPAGLRSWNGSDPAVRFAVYRNNIVVGLVDALAEQFPVCQELVGATFFRAMARDFVQQQPPRTRVIAFAGASFADFIATFPPAASVPYLADMARLEMTRIESCHAADADTLGAEAIGLAMADPEQLVRLRFTLHPSLRMVASPFAVFSLWAAHQGVLDIAAVDPDSAQQGVVFRDARDVQTLQIATGAFHFLTRLRDGDTLATAANTAAETDAAFDLPGSIALLLRHPLVIRMEPLP